MQIFEIQEPKARLRDSSINDVAIGIDFGTTNSLVAFSINHKPYIIDDIIVPSIISEDGQIGQNGIKSIKRMIGKKLEDIKGIPAKEENGIVKIKIGKQYFSIAEAISFILKHLRNNAETHLNQNVSKTVITVPAHFDDTMRNLIKHAANLAGMDVLRLISEPTAAAYAYGLDNASEGMYLVYDLGGGTFDVSLLNMRMGVFQVIATDGDLNLGGDDIDDILAVHLGCEAAHAKLVKENLSQGMCSEIDQKHFECLIDPIISKTIKITEGVAKKYLSKIKGIILVGGSTRIPLVSQKLQKFGLPILNNVDPDKVVALGAALQAENLTAQTGDLIIDVVPLSLGMELMGGLVEKIILRNTPIPVQVKKEFTTYADNQTAMQFHIVQGEREMANACRSLAKFELTNIPPMKAGAARIEVIFNIDADSLLSVTAIEKITGTKQIIEVRPSYGIAEKDIYSMLEDAYKNAAIDHYAKLLAETKIESEQEVLNVKAALEETPQLLSQTEKDEIHQLILELEKAITRDELLSGLQRLKKATHKFGERRMDFAVNQILRGKQVV
jgi:molecular chaperone HscA